MQVLSMQKGLVFQIQRFCVNDGPGIRTTVFFKGCPLRCIWCHNPESKSSEPEMFFAPDRCISCGQCANICPQGCHAFHLLEDGRVVHDFDRSRCTACGKCTEVCFTGALELVGRYMTVDEVMEQVRRDKPFYQKSSGGLTLSGGEPLFQPEFAEALLRAAKEEGFHTCVETSGYAKSNLFARLVRYVDLFLFDYKVSSVSDHKRLIGAACGVNLRNLQLLNGLGAEVILRCPIIPSCNDTQIHFAQIASIANRMRCVLEVQIEPYHPLGKSKSALLGKTYPLDDLTFPPKELVEEWVRSIQTLTDKPVKLA